MSTETATIASLAHEAFGHFERRQRDDGSEYVARMHGAPDWIADLAHDAHGDMFPDDWRYETIWNALAYLHDTDVETEDDAQDVGSEFADAEVDVYHGALLAWLGSHPSRVGYCDEARETFGSDDSGIMSMIQRGQYVEAEEVFASVVRSLARRLDDLR